MRGPTPENAQCIQTGHCRLIDAACVNDIWGDEIEENCLPRSGPPGAAATEMVDTPELIPLKKFVI